MIDADVLRSEKRKAFDERFNFEKFDAYVVEWMRGHTYLEIGVEYDSFFRESQDWNLCFKKGHKCYIWDTNIQVAVGIWEEVRAYLRECGFNVTINKACGYENPDELVIKL